jgi:hypothetical protein
VPLVFCRSDPDSFDAALSRAAVEASIARVRRELPTS